MSIVSNMHTATPYNAKQSKPFEGQRLVVTIAKKDKDGNYGQHLQQTMCTSIPLLGAGDIDWSSGLVQLACVDYLQGIQNAIISDRIKSGHNEVTTEQLSQAAILDYLTAETTGDKWDTARIAAWFTESLAEHIGVALIEKGYPDDKLDASLKAYEKLISETFSSKAAIPKNKATAISKAFALVDSPDATQKRFQARIDKVLAESNLDELLGL